MSDKAQRGTGMTIKIGIIGCGVMGADHARILLGGIPGGRLAAVHDADPRRAAEVAAPATGVRVVDTALDLIVDRDVDAVLIAAPNETHTALTIA
jgi:myo-inositol 2-dehydrogenase/D-chiro-inositol 1-dehydrogenase